MSWPRVGIYDFVDVMEFRRAGTAYGPLLVEPGDGDLLDLDRSFNLTGGGDIVTVDRSLVMDAGGGDIWARDTSLELACGRGEVVAIDRSLVTDAGEENIVYRELSIDLSGG